MFKTQRQIPFRHGPVGFIKSQRLPKFSALFGVKFAKMKSFIISSLRRCLGDDGPLQEMVNFLNLMLQMLYKIFVVEKILCIFYLKYLLHF